MHCLRDWSNRFSNNKACRGRFSIVDGHGFESILRGAMEVECKPFSKHLADEIKNKDDLLTLGPFVETLVAGPTMSITESLLVLGRLLARANQSAPSEGNGRQASSVDRPLRLTAAPRERPGCSPASPPPEGTSWPSSRCTDARTLPGSAAGALPRRPFCTCSGVSMHPERADRGNEKPGARAAVSITATKTVAFSTGCSEREVLVRRS